MIRAAVKANGIGLINSSLRSGVVSEAPISVTTRAVSRPISAIAVKSSDSVAIDTPSHETHCLGAIDDWEFAEIVEEIKIPAADPIPKNVFDAPPTIEEAKTATGELKDALEKYDYLQINSFVFHLLQFLRLFYFMSFRLKSCRGLK